MLYVTYMAIDHKASKQYKNPLRYYLAVHQHIFGYNPEPVGSVVSTRGRVQAFTTTSLSSTRGNRSSIQIII